MQRPATDAPTEESVEIDEGTRGALPNVMGPSTRRRIVEKTSWAEVQTNSSAEAITTQEGIDGYREISKRIAIDEQVELGNIMELSVMGHVLKWARPSNVPQA